MDVEIEDARLLQRRALQECISGDSVGVGLESSFPHIRPVYFLQVRITEEAIINAWDCCTPHEDHNS